MTGRIDVHSHIIPGVDDGCKTIEQSIECARVLVAAGYTHSFCTPHVWPSYAKVTRENVAHWTSALQEEFRFANVPLKLVPGGELNLHAKVMENPPEQIVPMALGQKYILADIWADKLPEFFEPAIRWLQGMGLTVILAHPERCRAFQDQPELADWMMELGVKLQGNLQCLGDRPEARTRQIAELYLRRGRYFLLGSDTHTPETMPVRMAGLNEAIAMVGDAAVNQLTIENPRLLLP
jgi:protein-tyrosine phosphatase